MKKKKSNHSSERSGTSILPAFLGKDRLRLFIIISGAVISYALLLTFTPLSFRYVKLKSERLSLNSPAPLDVIVADNIVYTDQQATEIKTDAALKLVLPIFKIDGEIDNEILENMKTFASIFAQSRYSGDTHEYIHNQMQASLPEKFSMEDITELKAFERVYELLPDCSSILEEILLRGIVNSSVLNEIEIPGKVSVWRWEDGKYEKRVLPESDIVTKSAINGVIQTIAAEQGIEADFVPYLQLIITGLVEINAFYSESETESAREQILKDLRPVRRKLSQGEFIIREGEPITGEAVNKIEFIIRDSNIKNTSSVLGTALFIIFLGIIAVFLLRPPLTAIHLNNTQLFILLGLYIFFVGISVILDRVLVLDPRIPFSIFLPTALFTMLISVIINSRVSFHFTLLLSLTVLVITRFNFSSFIFAFLSGIISILLIKSAEKRIELVRSIFYLSLFNGLIAILPNLLQTADISFLPAAFGLGAANAFGSGIVNLGLLPVFEHVLNVPTRFRLMELSDLNTPMLKKMLSMAPGTYSHSLNVANLAEAACKEIGANPLIARVGAYYHDIGKIEQAEYFIENQKEENKLTDLNPSLSVSVIKSHVKIGIEKAKELKLPKAVIDIISQHHGSGLINYFYAEAIKSEGNSKIKREDFSYTEPIPASKEAAVVMLADTIDAAVRTLQKPTVAKIRKYIWDLFMYKIQELQLNDCELTLKDLEIIKNTFVHILAGYFHARIEYPAMNGKEN